MKPIYIFDRALNVGAITLYPFVLVYYTKEECLEKYFNSILCHEFIHCTQVRKAAFGIPILNWCTFYTKYLLEYAWNRWVKKMDADTAYRNISYESQAFGEQNMKKWENLYKKEME